MQVENITDLSGRVEVVIGGTSGLGRSIAIGLARSGANVVASGRRKELVDEVCSEIENCGRDTLRQSVDVSKRSSIDALREEVLKRFERVDILVNAAGRTVRTPTSEVEEAEWNGIFDTN